MQKEPKQRHIFLTIWSWSVQLVVWTSLFIFILSIYYTKKFSNMTKKYPEKEDIYGVPYYTSNWTVNKMDPFLIPSLIALIVSYVAYIITEFCSKSFRFLCHKKDDNRMLQKMNSLFCGKPSVVFNCVCYHYETRTVHYTDSDGRSQTRSETYRVNTHFDSFVVPYHSVRDVSGPFVLNIDKANLMKKDLIKLKLELEITWADAISLSDYEDYKSDFIRRNENKDVYMDFSERRILDGFNAYNLIKINEKTNTCFLNPFWYIISIFLTLTQFYKWYFDWKCIYQNFKIIKLISTRYNLLQQEGYGEMQPKIDLINQQYDFELSQTAYCEDKEVDLPTLEDIQQAANKYGSQLPNLVIVNDNGIQTVRNLHIQNYNEEIQFNNDDKKKEDAKAAEIIVENMNEIKYDKK